MKIYNVAGWALVLAYALACMYFAPPDIGPWAGLLIGAAYAVACWLIGGVYLSCVIHMGIAHRALDCKDWFVKGITPRPVRRGSAADFRPRRSATRRPGRMRRSVLLSGCPDPSSGRVAPRK